MSTPAVPTNAFLSLGSNQGPRLEHLQAAVDALAAREDLTVRSVSPVYETEAHTADPDEVQPPFLNAVVRVETTLSPEQLLQAAHGIERAEGRDRSGDAQDRRWAPRPLDIDVLVYGTLTRQDERLTLPHPRLGERRFVLRPLADVAPNLFIPPPFDASVAELLARSSDRSAVVRTPHVLTVPSDATPR